VLQSCVNSVYTFNLIVSLLCLPFSAAPRSRSVHTKCPSQQSSHHHPKCYPVERLRLPIEDLPLNSKLPIRIRKDTRDRLRFGAFGFGMVPDRSLKAISGVLLSRTLSVDFLHGGIDNIQSPPRTPLCHRSRGFTQHTPIQKAPFKSSSLQQGRSRRRVWERVGDFSHAFTYILHARTALASPSTS
jgi:hypothetical protein